MYSSKYHFNNKIHREYEDIYINSLSDSMCAYDFIYVIRDGIKKGFEHFCIHWNGEATSVYPNASVPIASSIEYYKKQGIEFDFDINQFDYLLKCHFAEPMYYSSEEINSLVSPFDRLMKYDNSSQVSAFTQKCINTISHQTVCDEGIFDSLIWCINEVMDNVLVHSQSDFGYVMAQYHPNSKHIALCISDTGIGVYNSLRSSEHHPKNPQDALTLSILEGVGDGQGQGNGLFGLNQIVKSNGGRLTLTSGNASIMLDENSLMQKSTCLPFVDWSYPGTSVDFQLDLNKKVDIKSAFSTIGGFDGFDIRIDDMIQDNDNLLYDILSNCEGTATREAGRLLRNDIINSINRSKRKMILDFSNIETVSSSFIDELIAKMIIEVGVISFNQFFQIAGMNDTIKYLCERSIYMRIFEEWKSKRV